MRSFNLQTSHSENKCLFLNKKKLIKPWLATGLLALFSTHWEQAWLGWEHEHSFYTSCVEIGYPALVTLAPHITGVSPKSDPREHGHKPSPNPQNTYRLDTQTPHAPSRDSCQGKKLVHWSETTGHIPLSSTMTQAFPCRPKSVIPL